MVGAGSQWVEDADGFVEWAVGEPAGALSSRVHGYTGYREDTGPVHRLERPSSGFSLIVSFGDGFRAQAAPAATELSAHTSFAVGMHDRPSRTAHDGRQFGIQIHLDPLGAFALLDVSLHDLGNRVVALDELLGADAERWAGQLMDTRGWPARFALLDGLLAERMAAGPQPSPALAWA